MGVAKQSFSNSNKSRSTTPNCKCCSSTDQNITQVLFLFLVDFSMTPHNQNISNGQKSNIESWLFALD